MNLEIIYSALVIVGAFSGYCSGFFIAKKAYQKKTDTKDKASPDYATIWDA